MAKALLGHVGTGLDVRMADDLRRLRDRLRRLESENAALRAANDALLAEMRTSDDFTLSVPDTVHDHEPALT